MEKFILKTNKPNRFGNKVIIAGVMLSFDNKGVTEVADEKIANLLIKKHGFENMGDPIVEMDTGSKEDQELADIAYVLKEENKALKERIKELEAENESLKLATEKPKEETVKEEKSESTEEAEKPEEEDEGAGEETIEELVASKKKSELIELCEEFQLPKEEWKSLTAEGLRSFIIDKVKE